MRIRRTLGSTVCLVVATLFTSANAGFSREEPSKNASKSPASEPASMTKAVKDLSPADRKALTAELVNARKVFHEQHYVHGEADFLKSKVNKLLEEATAQQPTKPEAAVQLLTKAIAECDSPQEKSLYKTKLMANFVRSQTYLARGVCYLQQKKFADAEKDFTESIHYCSDYSTPYMLRAKALSAQNKTQQSMDDIAKSSTLSSAPTFVYKSVAGVSHKETSRLMQNSAEEHYAKYYVGGSKGREASKMETSYWEGRKLMDAGSFVPAIEKFTTAIITAEDAKEKALYKSKDMYNYKLSWNYENRAFCYLMMKNWNKAIDDLSKEIALRPNHQESYINRAKAYKALGKGKEAAADFAMAKMLKPNSYPKFLGDDLKATEHATQGH